MKLQTYKAAFRIVKLGETHGDYAGRVGMVTQVSGDPEYKGRGNPLGGYFNQFHPKVACEYISFSKDATCETVTSTYLKDLKMPVDKLMERIPTSGCQLGTDPEIFVVDKDGVVVPAYTFLPAKDKSRDNLFWDGFQAEFTMKSPHSCMAYCTDEVQKRLQTLWDIVKGKGWKLTTKSVVDVPFEMLQSATDEQVALGCAPSNNVYKSITRVDVGDPRVLPIRFAGAHLHFGMQNPKVPIDESILHRAVKTMDFIVGVMSVSLLQGLEDPRRRMFYGRPGEYRLPKYGLEYRTLSSTILIHPVVWHLCFEMARAGLYLGLHQMPPIRPKEREVIDVIMTYDVDGAQKILNRYKTLYYVLFRKRWTNKTEEYYDTIWDLIMKGAKSYFKDDIVKNWHLDKGWNTHCGNTNGCVMTWSKLTKIKGEEEV